MLEQTAARLAPLFPPSRQWVVTNSEQAAAVRKQMPRVPASHILAEPIGRNTAAAIGLAAAHLLHDGLGKENDALMAVLPADHYIAKPARYLQDRARRAARRARRGIARRAGHSAVAARDGLRIHRTRARKAVDADGVPVFSVRQFTEKPALPQRAEICGFRALLLERGNVFLARLDVSRQPREIPAEDS